MLGLGGAPLACKSAMPFAHRVPAGHNAAVKIVPEYESRTYKCLQCLGTTPRTCRLLDKFADILYCWALARIAGSTPCLKVAMPSDIRSKTSSASPMRGSK